MPRIADLEVQEEEGLKKRIAPNGNKLPDPIREGEVLTDSSGSSWKLGKSIGIGGFGEIYLASKDLTKKVSPDTQNVIKIEQYSNGPLFVEKNFYIRTARSELIHQWCSKRKGKCLGISQYFGSGSHVYRGERYRFLVLQRFGEDLGKLFVRHNRLFHIKTVLYIGIQILDVLEYIHSHGYVHADIKASNLILGRTAGTENRVYLVDFGLACKFCDKDGSHKVYRPDLRRAHTGTLEYTSRDAHVGALSRRGDLEILGYNLVQWLCGRLPWEDSLPDGEAVHQQKIMYMASISSLMRSCFQNSDPPEVLMRYLRYVGTLGFDTQPDYTYCKNLLRSGITEAGFVNDGKLLFGQVHLLKLSSKNKKKSNKRSPTDEPENVAELKPKKIVRIAPPRGPCVAHNFNRMTRNSHMPIVLRSHQFNWEKILSSHPERDYKKPIRNSGKAESPNNNTSKSEPVCPSHPTPAMLSVMARQRERLEGNCVTLRKGRSDSRCSSPGLELPELGPLTYAMEEVIRRREQNILSEQLNLPPESNICLRERPKKNSTCRRSPRLLLKPPVSCYECVDFIDDDEMRL